MRKIRGPFVGSEALAAGALNRHELRRYHRAVMPNVYMERDIAPTLRDRSVAAWLWSRGEGIVAGLSASAMHGAKWVDDTVAVELIWANARPPTRVITRDEALLDNEFQKMGGVYVTTPERSAFDLGRRGRIGAAVARLDALAAATHFKVVDVQNVIDGHRHTRGLRQLERALVLMDPGAESPKETWLRLLLIGAGYPRPQTQIPVVGPNGLPRYFLDMGWEDIMLAVEYDGGQHWDDPERVAYDIRRAEYLQHVGWSVVRVMKAHETSDVMARVRRAWLAATR